MDDEKRTTAIGFFNYAHSYWVSAVALAQVPRAVTHKDAPVDYLYYHAIELYLKSFLRLKGSSLRELRSVRHSIPELYEAAIQHGLPENAEDREAISLIPANYLPSRYLQTGAFTKAPPGALWRVCYQLHVDIEPVMNAEHKINRRRAIPALRDD